MINVITDRQLTIPMQEVELRFVGTLLHDPQSMIEFVPRLQAEYFTHPECRLVVDIIKQMGDKTGIYFPDKKQVLAFIAETLGEHLDMSLFDEYRESLATVNSDFKAIISLHVQHEARKVIDKLSLIFESEVLSYDDIIDEFKKAQSVITMASHMKPVSLSAAIDEQLAYEKAIEDGRITSGFVELDFWKDLHPFVERLYGLWVIAAESGVGKTSIMAQMSWEIAVQKQKPILFVTLEEEAREIAERIMKISAGAYEIEWERGKNRAMLGKLVKDMDITYEILDVTAITVEEFGSAIESAIVRLGPDVIVFADYFTRFRANHPRMSEVKAAEKMAFELADFSKNFKVPVIMGAQENQSGDRGRGGTKWGTGLFEAARGYIHVERASEEDNQLRGGDMLAFYVTKHKGGRFTGPDNPVFLQFVPELMRVQNAPIMINDLKMPATMPITMNLED